MDMRELKKGSLGLLVLHLLFEQPSYGWELCERLRQRSHDALSFEDSAIYPLLHGYERSGLVEGHWETAAEAREAERVGPRRRYYCLTPRGVEALRGLLQEWQAFTGAVNGVISDPSLAPEEGH
jgi:PadR family transcriptional regulator PadR